MSPARTAADDLCDTHGTIKLIQCLRGGMSVMKDSNSNWFVMSISRPRFLLIAAVWSARTDRFSTGDMPSMARMFVENQGGVGSKVGCRRGV